MGKIIIGPSGEALLGTLVTLNPLHRVCVIVGYDLPVPVKRQPEEDRAAFVQRLHAAFERQKQPACNLFEAHKIRIDNALEGTGQLIASGTPKRWRMALTDATIRVPHRKLLRFALNRPEFGASVRTSAKTLD